MSTEPPPGVLCASVCMLGCVMCRCVCCVVVNDGLLILDIDSILGEPRQLGRTGPTHRVGRVRFRRVPACSAIWA